MRVRTMLVIAAAAITSASLISARTAQAAEVPTGTDVDVYTDSYSLADPTTQVLQGTVGPGGTCLFKFPKLTEPLGGPNLEMRQVWTDFSTCTTGLETGIPPRSNQEPTPIGSGSATIEQTSTQRMLQRAAASGTIRFRVWWQDIIDLTVNWLQSNLTYTTNASCVTSASGSWSDYYRSGTGWAREYANASINPANCSYRRVTSNAKYHNYVFCAPTQVYVTYQGVTAQVTPAAQSGWVNSTFAQESPISDPLCPNLHFHQGFQ